MDSMKIQNVTQVAPVVNGKAQQKDKAEFEEVIKGAIKKVDQLEKEADQSVLDLLQGKASIHETMIALQKADMSMQLLLNIRNKVIESYREIMHMQF